MKKVFLFRNVEISSAKVSHALAVGLPSLTALTGMASAFAAELARSLGLPAQSMESSGVLFAFENYKLHEGYKKATERDGSTKLLASRALVAAYASFTGHFIIEVSALEEKAAERLANADLVDISRDVLRSLRLCGASLLSASRPVRLNADLVEERGSERAAALAVLPSQARVVVDASYLVQQMRDEGLPLMEGLVAATLRPSERPGPFKAFFEKDMDGKPQRAQALGVVHDGYLLLGEAGRQATRPSYSGEHLPLEVASPTLTLVRLQSAASLRSADLGTPDEPESQYAFWKTFSLEGGCLCRPTA